MDTADSDSPRSESRSPSPRHRDHKRKRDRDERWDIAGTTASDKCPFSRLERPKRSRPEHWESRPGPRPKPPLCNLFMQGKCFKFNCQYSHDGDPPQVFELCKFYLFDRCIKRDKCLYLHKLFPCKFFHTGRPCAFTKETCKFSHGPLNDTTRTLLLKVILVTKTKT